MENVVPPAGPLFIRVSKKGRTMAGRGKDCHWLTWGQLPVGDGQGIWHQDVWPPPDGTHYLMRGCIGFIGVAQYILAR